jgi:hypothetical protein
MIGLVKHEVDERDMFMLHEDMDMMRPFVVVPAGATG